MKNCIKYSASDPYGTCWRSLIWARSWSSLSSSSCSWTFVMYCNRPPMADSSSAMVLSLSRSLSSSKAQSEPVTNNTQMVLMLFDTFYYNWKECSTRCSRQWTTGSWYWNCFNWILIIIKCFIYMIWLGVLKTASFLCFVFILGRTGIEIVVVW